MPALEIAHVSSKTELLTIMPRRYLRWAMQTRGSSRGLDVRSLVARVLSYSYRGLRATISAACYCHCYGGQSWFGGSCRIRRLLLRHGGNTRAASGAGREPVWEIFGDSITDDFVVGDMALQNLTTAVATTARHIDTGDNGNRF